MNYDAVKNLIKSCGFVFALAIGLGVPISFGILDYLRMCEASQAEAEFHASYLSHREGGNGTGVSKDTANEILRTVARGKKRVRIIAADGADLAQYGPEISGGLASGRAVITQNENVVGEVVVDQPIGNIVGIVISHGFIAIILSVLTYIAVCALPGRALNEASREVADYRNRMEDKTCQLDAALSNMVQGLCLYDTDKRIVVANERYAGIYNLSLEAIKPGTHLEDVLRARVANSIYSEHEAIHVVAEGLAKFRDHVSEIVTLQDGRHISVVRRPLSNGGLITTHEDVTERKKADALIAHMAMHDALTGLPNRAMLQERLAKTLSRYPAGQIIALHCLDLDRFKAVNDTLGHPTGDALLQAVAERLQSCVRGSDLVARLGGDEFAILQIGVLAVHESASLARRVIAAMNEPFNVEGHRVSIGASVGVALAPLDAADGVALLKNADVALYCSKTTGRGRFHFFEPKMDAHIQERRQLELDLHNALALGQFELHYQPLIDLKSEAVVAMEALLRWNHPSKGRVGPSEFIPLMEEIGLIQEVGLWVIQEACHEAARWPQEVSVSVNLSAYQFKSPSLALDIASALAESKLDPTRLELEITESALMQNTETTLETLKGIRTLGVKVAMDDFGTGYSSLSYLHAFPFDKIKIDKCFVQSLSDKAESAHILKAVVDLGANLRMVTTAEGVETREQLDKLKEDGCTQVQGYYFSPPRPAHQLQEMMDRMGTLRAHAS